jgi:hypothetical protein
MLIPTVNFIGHYRGATVSRPKLRGALDDVQARLAKLETPPRLKAMGW